MSEFSFGISVTDQFGDAEAVGNADPCYFRVRFSEKFHPAMAEILDRFLTYRQDHIVAAIRLTLHKLEQVGVVAARKSSVAGDHDIQPFIVGHLLRIRRLEICISTGNFSESFLHDSEIRFALICLLLGFTKFGCRHQLHGLGDLHGVLNAFDPEFYSFHIGSCHILIPPLSVSLLICFSSL